MTKQAQSSMSFHQVKMLGSGFTERAEKKFLIPIRELESKAAPEQTIASLDGDDFVIFFSA